MSKKKIKLDNRVKKMANTSNWTRNVLKSMGFTRDDLIRDLMPNTADFMNSNSQVTDIIKDIRGNITKRKVMGTQMKTIPGLKTVETVFNNIKDDLKSGNFNNKDRENSLNSFGDDGFDFGFDDSMFGDEGTVEFLDDDSGSSNVPPTIIDTMPLARAINSSTEATVNTMIAVADQNMAIQTEKLLFDHKSSTAMLNGLTSINDNLATLVRFNADSTAKYHAASMKFYEEMHNFVEKSTKKEDGYDWSSVNDIFDSSGNVKISDYINRIKDNMKDKKDESMWGFFLDNLTNPMMMEGFVKNPIGTITRMVVPGLVNAGLKKSLKSLDDAMNSVIPAALARINTFDGELDGKLDTIFKIFNAREKLEYDVKLDKYEKGAIQWDGESKKALVEVIPTYLRRIESALTGEDERVFDYDKGNFLSIRDVKKRHQDNLKEKEVSGYLDTRIKLEDLMRELTGSITLDEGFTEDLDKIFSTMTKQGYHINHKKRRDRNGNVRDDLLDLFEGDRTKAELFRTLFNQLSEKDLTRMATVELNDSRKSTQRYIDEVNAGTLSSGANYIYNNSYFDEKDIDKIKYKNKGGILDQQKDKFGLGQLDYLRDIRKALIHGIKVFPDNSINDDGGSWNPNIDIVSREELEVEHRHRDEEVQQRESNDINNVNSKYKDILNMSQDQIDSAVNKVNRVREPKEYNNPLLKAGQKLTNTIAKPLTGIIDPITNKVNHFVYELLYGKDDTQGHASGTSFLGTSYEFQSQDYSNKKSMKDRLKSGVGILGGLVSEFMDGFNQFKVSLFGETGTRRDTAKDLFESFKNRLPKALGAGLKGGLIKSLIASKLDPKGGLLSSLILPGGPIGAAMLSMGTSMVTQSETFQRIMFGEIVDDEGNRAGGIIPPSLIEAYNEYGKPMKKHAGLGVLASFFLPGGPILGAITGIGAGLVAKSDAFQQFMFGDNYQDKDNRSIMDGAFGKLMKKMTSTKEGNDGNPKLATFLGGAGLFTGIAQGVGFLPSMLLPGGPILGSIFGLSAGIAASSEKFQKFLFGEKDEDGKRSGGILTKFANWFDVNVGERFRVKMAESNDRIYEFLNRKILFPIQDALDPIKQLGLNVLDDIKEAFHNVTDPVVESFKDNVTRPLGEWMREKFLNPITKRLKGIFGMIGKAIGGIVTSPIKLLTGLGNVADFINGRRTLKEERKNRRQQLKEDIKENGISGLISGVKNLRITKEEKQRLLTTGKMEYRAKREENRQKREEELQAQMEERQSKTQELQEQFEEDMKFGKGSGWRKPSKRTQEKQAELLKKKQQWLQEQNLIESNKINEKLQMVNDLLESGNVQGEETINTLVDMKNALVNQLKELGEKFKGTNANSDSSMPLDIKEQFSRAGIDYPQLFDVIDSSDESDEYKANRKIEFVERMLKNNSNDDNTVEALNGIKDSLSSKLKELGQSHEDGLDKVPYDGYVAELHEGEMVVPSSPAGKMRDMFSGNNTVSKLNEWVTKREDAEKQDRDDNALGLTDEEAAQLKEINDRKRYSDVSKKGVDYVMNKRAEEQKEKEERHWRSSILTAIESLGNKIGSSAKKSFDLFGKLGELLDKLPGSLGKLLEGLGITGILAGLTQVLGTQQFIDYSNKAEENNDSILDVYQGEHREERLDADGTYVYDNQLISTGQKLIRPGTMKALLKPEIVLYDKMVKPVVEQGGKAIDSAKKIGGKVVDYFNPNITKTGTTALGESYKVTMRKPDPTAGQKMMGKVLDGVNSAKAKSKGLFDEFMTLCKKALQIVADKFTEKFPKLASSKVVSSLDNVMGSLAKNADDIIKKFGKKIAVFIGDVALDFVPVVGQVTEICCTAYDVLSGLTAGNTGNMFGVPASHVDNEMRIICSVLQGLCKFSAMAVLWILNEISTSFLGVDIIQMLARFIYKILPVNLGKKVDLSDQLSGVKIDDLSMEEAMKTAGMTSLGADVLYKDGKLKDLSKVKLKDLEGTGISSAELQELARHQYNLENGTQLDSAAWNDKTNKTLGAKIMDSEFGRRLRGVTTAQNLGLDSTANVTLMDRIMNDAVTKGTGFMNLVGKVTGNEKLANATVKDNWLMKKYAGWRNEKYNKKMTKLEEEIAEKEAKGEDTTKLHKKLDKLKGKLGLSDSEYEELKASKNSSLMTGDAGMGEGEEFNSDKQKIVEVFDENGTLSHCITVPIKETTEIEGFSSSEILKPVSEYNTNKMQGIPQYDEKGNLVSYTTVDKRKSKTGGLFSKITSTVGSFFGLGNGSSNTDNSVDNSSSVTNNTGDTYNTTNEIDTTPFQPLTEAINSLVGINMEENVDEEGRAKTGGILKAIVDPMGFLFKNLLNVGINVKEGITGEETDPETVNKAVNTFKILRNPLGYLYNLTKGYFDGDEESVETVNTVKEKWNETKENAKNKLKQGKEWVEGKWNDFNQWKKDKVDQGKEWLDTKAQRSQETAAIIAGNKDAKANTLSTLISGSSDITAAVYNLFAKEDLTSGEIANATATFINKALVTPFKMLTDPAVEKFNEAKEAIGNWVNEKKDSIVGWWKENISEPWDKNKEKAKETQQAIIDDVKARKDSIVGWWKENISEPWNKNKEKAKETQQAIFDDVKARKDAIAGWWKENISEPWDKSKKRAEETQQAIIDDVKDMKDKITGWFSDHIKKPFEDTKDKIKKSVSGWVEGFKEKIVNAFNTYIKDPVSEALSPVITAVSGAWNSFKSAFSPFVDIFDYLTGKSDKSLTQIIKDYGNSGSENAGINESSDEIPTDNGVRSGAKSSDHIRPKKYRATDSDFITPTNNTTNNTTNTNTNNKFVFYNQSDSRWGQNRIGKNRMKDSGCGPTSLAMAVSQLTGEQITPDTIAKLGKEHIPGYSKYSLFPSVAEKLNMNYNEGYNENFIVSNLERGIPVLLSGKTNAKGTPYTSEGHVVTATRIKGDSIFINDPRGKEYSGYYPINAILEGLNKGMTVSPSNRTDVSKLSSGQLSNGWDGREYEEVSKEGLGIYGEVGEYSQLDENMGKTGAGQITMADRVLSYARAFLNNTSKFSYSQPRRSQIDNNKSSSKGCGADCSSFVSHVLSRAGDVNIYGTTSQTFWDSVGTKVDEPQIGDVVCQEHHVGLYSGNGNYIHMSGRKHGIRESKAIQKGNNPHRGYKRVLKNPSQLVDPTVPNPNTFLGTVVGTPSGQPVGGGTPSGPQASLDKALLIGDSLTVGMKPVLEGKYPNAKAMGKGGKWAKHWLESLGELPDASSVSTVIQWLGINGVHDKNNAKKSQELLMKLKEKYPNVPIFNMDIFPTTEEYSYGNYTGEWWRGLSQEFNKEMGTWTGANGINQINATDGFIQSDGFLDPSKAVDGIHFNTDGYKGVLSNIESKISSYNASNQGNSGGTTGGTPAVDTMGVFGKLSNIASGMIGSIFNGKDVFDSFMNNGTTTTTDPGTINNPGSNPDISNISDTAKAVWTFFTGKGYSPEATAGILGNMTQESGVDPTAIQGGGKGPAAGICQWENWKKNSARFKDMKAHAASKGKDWTDLQSQLEFIDIELQGKSPGDNYTSTLLKKNYGGYEGFKAIKDTNTAVLAFEKCFERANPAKANMPRRESAAKTYYEQFKSSGNLDITAGAGPATATTAETYTGDTIPTSLNGWAYYKQKDPQWQEDINGKKIGPSGCGMASHAMMLTTMFGKQITPVTVGKWARAKGHWSNGMGWGMPVAIANLFGLDQPYVLQKEGGASNSDLENVKAEIKAGRPVVLSGKGKSGNLNSPFTSLGHIVLAVGVDGSNRLIINDPRGMEYTKAYEDSGVMDIGTGLRGAWSFDLTSNSKIPDDWTTGNSFTPGTGTTPTDGTTPAVSTAPSVDMMGAFGQLGTIGNNMIASIFNEKDMFDVQATPTDGTTPINTQPVTGKGNFPKYALNDQQLKGIANILQHEQPGIEGRMAEASLMANLVDKTGDEKATVDNLIKKATGGWFAHGKSRFTNPGNPEQISIDAARSVLVEGKRTLPRYVDEHDCFSDLEWVKNNGTSINKKDRSQYKPHVTKIKNVYGASGTFHSFPNDKSDPFYYTSEELRQKWGDDCYSPTSSTPGDAGQGDGNTYWAKGFGDNKPNKVNYTKGHAGMGEGESTNKLVNARRNMEKSIREIDRNMNVVNNTTNINNTNVSDACVDMMKVILQELHAINNNTAETAKGVNNIEIVSANEPINGNINTKVKKNTSKPNHSNGNTGYDLARKIASYK